MAVTTDDVRRVARLAKLALSEAEVEDLQRELGRILDYVEKLRELDLEGVDPVLRRRASRGDLREDEVGGMLGRSEVTDNAPDTDGRHFRVPGFLPEA